MYLSRRSVPMGVGVASTGRSAAATDAAFWCWRGVVTEARRHFHRIITIGSHERLIATRWEGDGGSLNSPHKTPGYRDSTEVAKDEKKNRHIICYNVQHVNKIRHVISYYNKYTRNPSYSPSAFALESFGAGVPKTSWIRSWRFRLNLDNPKSVNFKCPSRVISILSGLISLTLIKTRRW